MMLSKSSEIAREMSQSRMRSMVQKTPQKSYRQEEA